MSLASVSQGLSSGGKKEGGELGHRKSLLGRRESGWKFSVPSQEGLLVWVPSLFPGSQRLPGASAKSPPPAGSVLQ